MGNEVTKRALEEQVEQHKERLWKRINPNYEKCGKDAGARVRAMEGKIRDIFQDMAKDLEKASPSNKPSGIIERGWRHILDAYVPENKQGEFLYIVDKYCKFPYSLGYCRRTVRSKKFWALIYMIKGLFEGYYNLTLYAGSMADYYNGENAKRHISMRQILGAYSCPDISNMDDLIAAELDMGATNLAQSLEDILMSENNTNIVTTQIIRGIVKSDNSHLHKVLGDFLLAARLQEGVRQAVCENMDQGTAEAFLACFQVIADNDLIRFSAVKRAVSTWTGICDENNLDRISGKQLEIMKHALKEPEYVQELLRSNDSIELYIGLWAQGFYEVEDAIASCKKLIVDGERNQKLVVSYYNRSLQDSKFTMEAARLMLETYPEDRELCAAFLPTYMPDLSMVLSTALYGKDSGQYWNYNRKYVYERVSFKKYFESEEQARKHFELLRQLKESLPKKGHVYSPCIFPWYSVEIAPSDVVVKMAMIAYMLQSKELIDYACTLLPEMSNTYERRNYLRLLLHMPRTQAQKDALLHALADKAGDTREEAFKIVSEMKLTKEDYSLICTFLRYKASDIRKNVLGLIEKQPPEDLAANIQTLLSDKKEEMRLGGLDLLVRLKKDEGRKDLFEKCKVLLEGMDNATEKESVIIAELTGNSQADGVLGQKGYGLYDPDAEFDIPAYKGDAKFICKFFHRKKKEMYGLLDKLEELYEANGDREYKNSGGEEVLLGNVFAFVQGAFDGPKDKDPLDKYPFPELWRSFYEEHIKDFATLVNLRMFIKLSETSPYERGRMEWFSGLIEKIYGKDYLQADISSYKHQYCLKWVVDTLYRSYCRKKENQAVLKELAASMLAVVVSEPVEMSRHARVIDGTSNEYYYYAFEVEGFSDFASIVTYWKTDEEFDKMFMMCQSVNAYYGKNVAGIRLHFLDYVKAYTRNLITLDNVYQAAFDILGLSQTFNQMCVPATYPNVRLDALEKYLQADEEFEKNEIFQTALKVYWDIVEMVLKVELKRSELPTDFSYAISKISKVRGTAHLVDILTALGKDTLERSVYYSYYGNHTDKRTCLSHLLHVSEPLPGEDAGTLRELLKGRKISDKRLVETAMYNASWIEMIEEYLGWSGLKSGIYYFTAHMNERFSDRTAAMIAKYTPLTQDELNDGAFDLNWFLECSKKLGEKRFQVLYDSAKYISDSNKHTRARKYADAVQEKVSAEELEAKIEDKRNKDLLMSYPLVPLKNDKEVLHRYQFLQKFLKESKQFGAQRRASEGKAVQMGLQNLAMRSGYEDVTRLTLNMETKLVEELKAYFDWQEVEDAKLKIVIGEDGKPSIACEKNGKALKSVPAKIKKHPQVVEINDVCKQLKNQYVRTKAMMEQFMEDGVEFTAQEMANLQKNPVILPILQDLVYICKEGTGFLSGKVLTNEKGEEQKLTPKKKLRIAHPYDLWNLGVWQDYQKILFEKQVKQPFKQVFRELYVKTEEELDKTNSTRYAGNQIQPRKTVGCLRGRRWVADYEDGLQKVYYKENIVATIYALADWFSPSDIEAPTLEWVEFFDRKTFKPIKIKDVPERIFSEVMRDVDLAVSVAHAGGVDPETSHSTMEMRRAIVEFNLPLFGLTNVTFAGNHAVIEGKRGSYTVHLGSGVIFQQGGTQIAVLPVHSQHRGKLFLPFIDEDPKTAEIMSKIVLFAEDMKIKDPYILEQLTGAGRR